MSHFARPLPAPAADRQAAKPVAAGQAVEHFVDLDAQLGGGAICTQVARGARRVVRLHQRGIAADQLRQRADCKGAEQVRTAGRHDKA